MALEQYKTQVLLLHSEQSTLDTLSTGFNNQYSVHMATSGIEALNIFTETPVHVIVSAQDLPGMSGLDALREAKKRSPETIGILLAGTDHQDGLEAMVGDQEVFQIIRGKVTPQALRKLIDTATKRARLIALSQSANDSTAGVDHPMAEHIVMETSDNGSSIISDGTDQMLAIQAQKISNASNTGSRNIDVLVLTKDEEFLATVKDSSHALHTVHHCELPSQAVEIVKAHKIGVLVTDAAMVGSKIELLTQRLRQSIPRLVAVVAGRRDDGELLMDLINRGQVYRFLLKPVSPGRAKLAIEASIKYHLDAPDKAFKSAPSEAPPPDQPPQPGTQDRAEPVTSPRAEPKPTSVKPSTPAAQPKPTSVKPSTPAADPASTVAAAAAKDETPSATVSILPVDSFIADGLDGALDDEGSLRQTITGISATLGRKMSDATESTSSHSQDENTEPMRPDLDGEPEKNGLTQKAAILGIAAVAIAGIAWFSLGSDKPTPTDFGNKPIALPVVVESDITLPRTTAAIETEPAGLLTNARNAREAGRLVSPATDNAVELYVAALQEAPGNPVIPVELDIVLDQVFSMAESAILVRNLQDAAQAIRVLKIASPENPRLIFLSAQLSEMQVRNKLDQARSAIREGRFEDAGAAIAEAGDLAGDDNAELKIVSNELAAARSAQQVDEVLALASSRLEQDQLLQPANDSARYYYELALSNDPNNTAARQGLTIVASKLVLQAREALDNGRLSQAEGLLANARLLDPSSKALAAPTAALENAKAKAAAEAARLAELKRAAEQERIAEEQRAAEEQRIAEEQRVAEEQRIAEEQRLKEEQRIAEEERLAEQQRSAAADDAAVMASSGNKPMSDSNIDNAATDSVPRALTAIGADAAAAGSASPQEPATDQSRSGGTADTGAPATSEIVPISSLTRVNYVAAKYPRSAHRRNISGSVDLSFTVTRDGTVTNVAVLNSKPGTIFDNAAMDAVAQWRFEPTIENGQAVEKKSAVRLAFTLE